MRVKSTSAKETILDLTRKMIFPFRLSAQKTKTNIELVALVNANHILFTLSKAQSLYLAQKCKRLSFS